MKVLQGEGRFRSIRNISLLNKINKKEISKGEAIHSFDPFSLRSAISVSNNILIVHFC